MQHWPTNPAAYQPSVVGMAGDWHGSTHWAQHALGVLAEAGVQVVVHVGDFGFWTDKPSTRKYLHRIERELSRNGQILFWVDGNHEDHDRLDSVPLNENGTRAIGEWIVHLPRGFRWSWPGPDGGQQTWLALGGAASIDRRFRKRGRSWWPQEILSEDDVASAVSGGPADVMVCHDAPAGVPYLGHWLHANGFKLPLEEEAYSRGHRDTVRTVVDEVRPKHLWHGHYHVAYQSELDLGDHRVHVHGLDMDGESGNLAVWNLASEEIRQI